VLEVESDGSNRRLGERFDVYPVVIDWHPDLDDVLAAEAAQDALDAVQGGPEAYLVELSVSGAAVIAPVQDHVVIGTHLKVGFHGAWGAVVVRRIGELQDQDYRFYGVEFTEPNSPLNSSLYDAFLANRSRVARWRDPSRGEVPAYPMEF
jgi:hypothetical protein